MAKKLFGIFDKRPKIWLHYAILSAIVPTVNHYIFNVGGSGGISPLIIPFQEFLTFFVVISISDQIIHKILGVD